MADSGNHLDHAKAAVAPPLSLLVLVSLLTVVTLECVRSTGPLLEYAFDVGIEAVAATAIATYLAPGLLALVIVLVGERAGAHRSLLIGVLLLALLRLVLQGLTANTRMIVGLMAIALSITTLTLGVTMLASRRDGGRAAAAAVAYGAAIGVGLQLTLGTWDAYWRHSPAGWAVTASLLAALVASAGLANRHPATAPTTQIRRIWVLGPVLSLLVMALANSGFAASQSGVRLSVAGPIAAIGLLMAGCMVWISAGWWHSTPSVSSVIAIAPAITIGGVYWTDGPVVLVLLVASQLAVIAALAGTLDGHRRTGSANSLAFARTSASASLIGLGTILPLLVFQFDYDIPLGFPNELVVVAAALTVGLAVVGRGSTTQVDGQVTAQATGTDRAGRTLLAGAAAVVLIGSAAVAGRALTNDPRPAVETTAEQLTLMSWNLHYGVSPEASVDLEQIARSIEQHRPDIVLLQEVSRGWVLGGGTDMATWLAERLDMNFAFAPAADRQFGNAILTNLPHDDVAVVELPYGQGPQERSAISADILIGAERVRVVSVHLQNKGAHTNTRLAQIDTLLRAEGAASTLIVGGDFNAQPESPEINRMTDSGMVSAQDVSGDPSALTDPSVDPEKRIDWVFGRGVSFVKTEVLGEALSSDHLPLVVSLTVGDG